jgi:hypothetical protein
MHVYADILAFTRQDVKFLQAAELCYHNVILTVSQCLCYNTRVAELPHGRTAPPLLAGISLSKASQLTRHFITRKDDFSVLLQFLFRTGLYTRDKIQ